MADLVGYILTGPDGEVESWGGIWGQNPGVPNPLHLPNGKQILAPVVGTDYDGYSLSEWLMDEPEPEPVTPHLNNGGLARFSGPAPVVVYEAIHMAGVTRISKGRYRVTHETAMPSDQYSAFPAVFDASPRIIRLTARTATYVEVRVTDLAGAVQDPTEASVKTERVVTE